MYKTFVKRCLFSGIVLACAALLSVCGGVADEASTALLQGTWETNEPSDYRWYDCYNGGLVIGDDTITITGYPKDGFSSVDAATIPFAGFTKNAELRLRIEKTEDLDNYPDHTGMLYITDKGVEQTGIPYTFCRTGTGTSSSPYVYFLYFTFGGREETLRRVAAE